MPDSRDMPAGRVVATSQQERECECDECCALAGCAMGTEGDLSIIFELSNCVEPEPTSLKGKAIMADNHRKDTLEVLFIDRKDGKDSGLKFQTTVLANSPQEALLKAMQAEGAPSYEDVLGQRVVFSPKGDAFNAYPEMLGSTPYTVEVVIIATDDKGRDKEIVFQKTLVAPIGMELVAALASMDTKLDPDFVADKCRCVVRCV
jgi:hypothetical protein